MATLAPSRTALRALRSLAQAQAQAQAQATRPALLHASACVREASPSSSSSTSSAAAPSAANSYVPVRLRPRTKPSSPSYYSGRPVYIDNLLDLEDLLRVTTRLLTQAHAIAPNSDPPVSGQGNLWLSIDGLRSVIGTNLKTAQYRQLITRLNLLARYRILVRDHLPDFTRFEATITRYMTEAARAREMDAKRAASEKGVIDDLGRAYARGRRKESSARVWLIPTKENQTSEMLINNQSLPAFFTRTADREAVNWPFKLTGTLGAYNVFALTRGGGSSGQAGAIAHAIANALVAMVAHSSPPESADKAKAKVRSILSKGKHPFPPFLVPLPIHIHITYSCLCPTIRRHPQARPAYGREEEDRSRKGQEGLHVRTVSTLYPINPQPWAPSLSYSFVDATDPSPLVLSAGSSVKARPPFFRPCCTLPYLLCRNPKQHPAAAHIHIHADTQPAQTERTFAIATDESDCGPWRRENKSSRV